MIARTERLDLRAGPLRRFLKPLVERRTYRGFLHVALDLPVGTVSFTVVVTLLTTAVAMAITVVGIPLAGLTMVVARRIGELERARASRFLGTVIARPSELPRVEGHWPQLRAQLRDPVAWRACWYSILLLPVGIVTFTVAVTACAMVLAALTLPAWYWSLPQGGAHLFPGVVVRTPISLAVVALLGLAWAPIAAWVVRGCAAVDLSLVRRWLSPVGASNAG